MDIQIGDRLTMKKNHPCGGTVFEVLRTGMDFKLKCAKCGHIIELSRTKAEKNIRAISRGQKE